MKISYKWLKEYVPDLPRAEKLRDVFTFHVCEVESIEKLPPPRPLGTPPRAGGELNPLLEEEGVGGGDWIFDLNILPDRAHDLLSHRGVAFELTGLLGLSLRREVSSRSDIGLPKGPTFSRLQIKVESDKCRRYMGRIVRNVKVGPSPAWLKERLESIGQRSINNIVDITNYILNDLGQPVHVFDLDKISSLPRRSAPTSGRSEVVIRDAKAGEKITTLDGKIIELQESDLVITSPTTPPEGTPPPAGGEVLAIAGVKGGKSAEVDENTKNIIIEVANFDPTSVRKTAHQIKIHTDAVKRFENNLSPELCGVAMDNITALILDVCPEAKVEEVVDYYPDKQEIKKINFSADFINKKLGANISASEVEIILKNYKYDYVQKGNNFEIIVPPLRLDLETANDMVEEIGRVYGYDKVLPRIPKLDFKGSPKSNFSKPEVNETFYKILSAREKLLSDGYSEVMTYTFRDHGKVEVLESASDKKFLRTNLSDGLKESYELNKLNAPMLDLDEIKIFEIGTVFLKDKEIVNIAYGNKKEMKEMSLEEFLQAGGDEFHPRLDKEGAGGGNFKMWSSYPFISRDISVWVPEGVESSKVYKIIKENAGELLIKEPKLVDEYKKENKISYAFRLVFQSMNRTLTDDKVNEIMIKIYTKIAEQKDWQVR